MILAQDISIKLLNLLLAQLQELGLFPVIGAEIEFYSNYTNLQACLDVAPEKGLNQFEVRIKHQANILAVIEEIENSKKLLIEKFQGNLSAKPYADQPGNALHIHLHLQDAKGNNLYMKQDEVESELMLHSIGGLCASMQENMLIFAPYEQAYLRYKGDSMESPCKICWGGNNRSAAIRIPLDEKYNRRLEHRMACADSDAREVIIAILFGAIKGIKEKMAAPEKLHGNAFLEQYDFQKITQNYTEALENFSKSELYSSSRALEASSG